jgi:hypothetical protein
MKGARENGYEGEMEEIGGDVAPPDISAQLLERFGSATRCPRGRLLVEYRLASRSGWGEARVRFPWLEKRFQ